MSLPNHRLKPRVPPPAFVQMQIKAGARDQKYPGGPPCSTKLRSVCNIHQPTRPRCTQSYEWRVGVRGPVYLLLLQSPSLLHHPLFFSPLSLAAIAKYKECVWFFSGRESTPIKCCCFVTSWKCILGGEGEGGGVSLMPRL